MKKRKIKMLHEAYLDMNLAGTMMVDKQLTGPTWVLVLLPPRQFVRWVPWRLWSYTGFTIMKLKYLQRNYIRAEELVITRQRIESRLTRKPKAQFSVGLRIGSDYNEEAVAKMKRVKSHPMGDCLSSFMLMFYPTKSSWKVYPIITWRTAEITRRFAADLVMVDNLLHDLLDPFELYSMIDYAVLEHGSFWLSACVACLTEYTFPGITNLMPEDSSFKQRWIRHLKQQQNAIYTRDRSDDENYIKFGPIRNAVRTLNLIREQKLSKMFAFPLSAKCLHPRARGSDFPRHSFG